MEIHNLHDLSLTATFLRSILTNFSAKNKFDDFNSPQKPTFDRFSARAPNIRKQSSHYT